MVIETFKDADANPIGERLKRSGRLMPEGIALSREGRSVGLHCFQVMETPNVELMNLWVSCWADLFDFEIVPEIQGEAR